MPDTLFTLIVPDIHEEIDRLNKIRPMIDRAERVVILGDLCDTFKPHRVDETLDFLQEFIDDPRFTWLWGNHDCHYVFDHGMFRCSGWNYHTYTKIFNRIPEQVWKKFKLWTTVGKFLVSHAGFSPDTYHLASPAAHEAALKAAFDGDFHPMFTPGECVGGGKGDIGGPTWMRWNTEFRVIPGVPQIVGHTRDKFVRVVGEHPEVSYCLDTGLHHVILTDGEEVKIVRVDEEEEKKDG